MSEELKLWLEALAIGVPIGLALGLIVGIAVRKLSPNWVKRYAKSQLRPWKHFAALAVVLAILAVLSYLLGHPYACLLALVACIFDLMVMFVFGFRPLRPEDEKRIDEWDPRKLWPPFW